MCFHVLKFERSYRWDETIDGGSNPEDSRMLRDGVDKKEEQAMCVCVCKHILRDSMLLGDWCNSPQSWTIPAAPQNAGPGLESVYGRFFQINARTSDA